MAPFPFLINSKNIFILLYKYDKINFMDNKKEFYYKYFEEKILPNIHEIEKYRVKLIQKLILSSFLFFVIAGFLAYLFVLIMLNTKFNPILFPLILFFMYVFFIKSIINFILVGKKYQEKLLEDVFPLFLKPIANFKPWPKNSNTEAILDSQLFYNFDTQEDVASYYGFYNKTGIILSNTKLTLPVRGINKPNLFKGTIIQLELDKSINNHIILFSKNEHKCNYLKQINPHIQELNQYLYAFAKDTQNISCINNKFWNVIKNFGEIYTAKGFELSYRNNIVLIAIRQKRPMQFGFLFRSLLKAKNYDDLIDRFIVIYDLIDVLNNA